MGSDKPRKDKMMAEDTGCVDRMGVLYMDAELLDKQHRAIIDAFYELEMLVVRAEYRFDMGRVMKYTCRSPMFDKVPTGQRIPVYNIHFVTEVKDEKTVITDINLSRHTDSGFVPIIKNPK